MIGRTLGHYETGATTGATLSPDGRMLAYASADGGAPVATGALKALVTGAYTRWPCEWFSDRILYMEGAMVESTDVFAVPIAPGTWQVRGPARRLTAATNPQFGMSVARDGRFVVTSAEPRLEIWSAHLDPATGRVKGPSAPVTRGSPMKGNASCDRSGATLAYTSWAGFRAQRRVEVRVLDVPSGQERAHTATGFTLMMQPRLSADGRTLAYRDVVDGRGITYVVAGGAGSPRNVCRGCTPVGFDAPADRLLVVAGDTLAWVDLATGAQNTVLRARALQDADVSPDGRWLAFSIDTPKGGRQHRSGAARGPASVGGGLGQPGRRPPAHAVAEVVRGRFHRLLRVPARRFQLCLGPAGRPAHAPSHRRAVGGDALPWHTVLAPPAPDGTRDCRVCGPALLPVRRDPQQPLDRDAHGPGIAAACACRCLVIRRSSGAACRRRSGGTRAAVAHGPARSRTGSVGSARL